MKINLVFVLFLYCLFPACETKHKEEKLENKIIENIDLNDYRDRYHVGEYFQDTLMYVDGGIGARISYDFVDKKGNYYRFGELRQDFDLINEKSFEANPKFLNKIFLVGHRLMISKGFEEEDFVGDKSIGIITTMELLEKETPFKIVPVLSEEEKLIEELKKKYKYVRARYADFSVGDLFHYSFIDDKGNEYDFNMFEDRTYELSVSDPNSEYGESINAKYKNRYFHIFTKTDKMDLLGWGQKEDVDIVVKLILEK